MFFQYGAQKLFGWFNGSQLQVDSIFSHFGVAGVIEFFGGIFLVIGLLTRITAAISAIQMFVAYVWKHAPNGLMPITNGGEAALLFFAAFLVILVYGARKWGVDKELLGCSDCV